MRFRGILAAGSCLVVVVTAGVAGAAPRAAAPLCKLLTDPANDSTLPGRPYDASLDIVSADVANDAKTLTAVLRLAKLTADDVMAPTGRFYTVRWVYKSTGVNGQLSVEISPTGTATWGGVGARTVVDLVKSELRISAPIDGLSGHPLFAPTERLVGIGAVSDLGVPVVPSDSAPNLQTGVTVVGAGGDDGTSKAEYPVGARSCVKPGA
jgi:hypothetical protein